MYNFKFSVPTTIYFGKGQISHLSELAGYGTKVLLVYGGGSIRRNGICKVDFIYNHQTVTN